MVQQYLLHMLSATPTIHYTQCIQYSIQFYNVPIITSTQSHPHIYIYQVFIGRTVEDRKVTYMLAWHLHQMSRTCLILNRCLARHSASERHDHPTTEMENKEVAWFRLPHLVTWLVMSSDIIDLLTWALPAVYCQFWGFQWQESVENDGNFDFRIWDFCGFGQARTICYTLQSTLQLSSSDPQMPQMEAICKIPKIPTIKGSSMTSWQWKHGTLRPKYPWSTPSALDEYLTEASSVQTPIVASPCLAAGQKMRSGCPKKHGMSYSKKCDGNIYI